MADYRKSLMDMTPEERAEVAPGFVPSDDVSTPLSVKVADEAISLATPIDSIVEVQQELAKDEPDYLKIGALAGTEAIGLIPGLGSAAKNMIRQGAKFKTKRGSVYTVEDQSRTTRERAPDTPGGEFVKQPTSGKTVYMSYEDMERFGPLFQKGEPELYQFVPTGKDKAQLVFTKEYGPYKAGDAVPNTEVSYTLEPQLGLNPVEIYDSINKNKRSIHFGNEIVEVTSDIPKVPRGTGAIDTTKSSVEAAGLTDEAIDAWREANATSPEFRKALKGRNEELMDLAAGVKEGRVFNTTYWKRADELRPIRKVTEVPKPATVQDTVSALDKGKRKSPIVGLNYDIPDGEKITARLDIPAYVDYDVWIPTLRHSGKTMYKPALRMKNVKFIQPEGRESGMALDVAVGPQRLQDEFGLADKKAKAKGNKSPFAVMEGEYVKATDDEAYEYATSIFDSDEWTQAGYDPSKRGFFYDRETGEAILSGDEVVQVGHLVLVKNAEKVNPEVFGFSEGGMAMNEQMNAVFKSSRTGYAEGGEVGAAPDTTIGVDPVSGNEVPMGATPEEVRDDIPAQLSEGEYVVPADVVRFYGVKFFEDLRTEAKQGYAEMDQNGRIGGEPVGPEGMEMIEPEDDLPFDISELQMIDDEVEMAEGGYLDRAINRETPYNNFEKLLQFLFKDKDEYGETPIDRYKEQMGDDDMGFFESFMGSPIERGERKWGKRQYNEGGLELPDAPAATPVPANPFSPTGTTAGFEIKEYVNDAGEVMFVQFMNGQPMTFIPEGFKPKGSVAEEVSEETAATAPTPTDNDNDYDSAAEMGKVDTAFVGGASATDWTRASIDDFAKATSNLDSSGLISGLAGALLPGPIGIAAGIGSKSQARVKAYDMIDGIAYQLESGNLSASQRDDLIKQKAKLQEIVKTSDDGKSDDGFLGSSGIYGGASSMYERLDDTSGDGKVSFADTWLGDLLGADGKAGVQGPSLSESREGARRSGAFGTYEGSRDRAAERMKAREATPYEKAMEEEAYGKAADIATGSWQAATNAVNSASASDDPAAWSAAIKAQSEASKAATAAIKKASGWGTENYNPNWRDDKDED